VKVKAFRAPRRIVATLAQTRSVLRGFAVLFRARIGISFALFFLAIAAGVLIWPYDPTLLAQVHFWSPAQEQVARHIAGFLSNWGDYHTYNVPLALAIWLYGVATKSCTWRRVAVVCFLGATTAGLFDDCFRLTLGRPRPDSHMADHFYGMPTAWKGGFQSFPSGHAASVFGAAAALLVTDLPLGILTTIYALGVAWARMEIYRHYPSDIAVGTLVGLYFGLMIGWGARVRWANPRWSKSR
jgi:membrane-associated phospholipid phosphatase